MTKSLVIEDPVSIQDLLAAATQSREQADVIRAGAAEQQRLGLGAPKHELDKQEQLAVDATLAIHFAVKGFAPVKLAPYVVPLSDFEWLDGPKHIPDAFILPAKTIMSSQQPWRYTNHYREVIRGPRMFALVGLQKLDLRLPHANDDILELKREITRHVPDSALFIAVWARRLPFASPECVLLCKAGERYFRIASWK
jgi:hypothetical protein